MTYKKGDIIKIPFYTNAATWQLGVNFNKFKSKYSYYSIYPTWNEISLTLSGYGCTSVIKATNLGIKVYSEGRKIPINFIGTPDSKYVDVDREEECYYLISM